MRMYLVTGYPQSLFSGKQNVKLARRKELGKKKKKKKKKSSVKFLEVFLSVLWAELLGVSKISLPELICLWCCSCELHLTCVAPSVPPQMSPRLLLGFLNSLSSSLVGNERAAAPSVPCSQCPQKSPLTVLCYIILFSEIAQVELHTNPTVIHPRTW